MKLRKIMCQDCISAFFIFLFFFFCHSGNSLHYPQDSLLSLPILFEKDMYCIKHAQHFIYRT